MCCASCGSRNWTGETLTAILRCEGQCLRFLERLLHHADGQRPDQPGLLGGLDERFRLEEAAGRRAPAGQRLETDQLAGGEVDQRLEEGNELAVLDAAADVLLQLHAVGELALQLRVEPGEAVPAGALGGVEREVALAKDVLLLLQTADLGEADRRGHEDLHVAEVDRLRQLRQDRLGELLRILGRRTVEQNRELVAADAGAAAALRRLARRAYRPRCFEQLVADEVAVKVVDPLEMVEVEQEQDARALAPPA